MSSVQGSRLKTEVTASDFEIEADSLQHQSRSRLFRILDTSRTSLTAVALALAIAALGVSAHSLSVYQRTHVAAEFMLPLWPDSFNVQPTVALVACSAIIMVSNIVSLLECKMSLLRQRSTVISTLIAIGAPLISFIVALVAMCYFYAVNASADVDTIQSWTCRWREVSMMQQPYFGTLCRQSEASIALAIVLVPLEVVVCAVAAYQVVLRRQISAAGEGPVTRTKSSASY